MPGVNKVILMGNLGRDPDVRYLPSGDTVANLSIATNDSWRDRDTGLLQEQTEWHRVVFHGRLAEVAGHYLRKGSKVYVEGALHTRKWQDRSGQERVSTEIEATTLQMVDSRGTRDAGNDHDFGSAPHRAASRAEDTVQPALDFDNDIPF